MITLSSWGRVEQHLHEVIPLNDPGKVPALISRHGPGIAYGMGRSYGDVCLNPGGVVWNTTGLNHLIQFDDERGLLRAEAGVLLRDIQRLFTPRGWMLPVTPGTQLITLGGAIANDVHGKNHHVQGSFGDHVRRIRLVRSDGEVIECTPHLNPAWFSATMGGLGLTGVIVEVDVQLRRTEGPWLESETISYANLDEFFHLADSSETEWEYTVSWIDCLSGAGGRGIFMRANHVADQSHAPTKGVKVFPFEPPISLVNRASLQLFNSVYFNLKSLRVGRALIHYEPFFYPLDNILEWNRMYGPKGFFQYQGVVPRVVGREALRAMLEAISHSGEGSFLAVLKTFGDRQSPGMLSFPQPGVTLALDFPNRGKVTHKLFERLDAIVREAAGRLYPAKDGRMPRSLFEAGYPRLSEFMQYRDSGISSAMSRRLMGS